MFKSYDVYRIKIYSPIVALNKIKNQKIPIFDFKEVEDYTYEFKVSPKYKKEIKEVFNDAVLIERYGPYAISYNLIVKKTTIISLVISLIFFFLASTRIYDVKIFGSSPKIDSMIYSRLEELSIKKYMTLPSNNKIREVSQLLELEFKDSVEFFEINKNGLIIEVKYETRREPIVLPQLNHTLVAKREGVIVSLLVEHGLKMVQVNDYVNVGDILVSSTIPINETKLVEVFAKGIVMAHTWRIVEVSIDKDGFSDEQALTQLLFLSKRKALEDCDRGQIDGENILSFEVKDNKATLKVHYQVLENIAVETIDD